MGTDEALAVAGQVFALETATPGLHVECERVLSSNRASNSYYLAVRTERDKSDDGANSYFTIGARDGRLLHVARLTGNPAATRSTIGSGNGTSRCVFDSRLPQQVGPRGRTGATGLAQTVSRRLPHTVFTCVSWA